MQEADFGLFRFTELMTYRY